jgi:hypothetical protein
VPALIFFVGVLVLSIRTSHSIHKNCGSGGESSPLAHTAVPLELALVAYGVSSFFASVAYSNLLPSLAGIAVALERSAALAAAGVPAQVQAPMIPFQQRHRGPCLRVQNPAGAAMKRTWSKIAEQDPEEMGAGLRPPD